jgi:hypothetical protein
MSDPGWTLDDLAGEIWARGIDIDDVSDAEIQGVLRALRPETAAECVANGTSYEPPREHPEGCECSRCQG